VATWPMGLEIAKTFSRHCYACAQEPLRQPLRAAMWLQAARPQNCRGHTLRCCTSSRSSESGLGGSGWMRGRASPLRPPLCSAPPRASPTACRLAALLCADWEPLSLLRRLARPCGSCAGAAGLGFRSCGDGGDEPCAAKLGAPPPSGAPADGSAAGGEPPAWVTACPETQQHHMQARVREWCLIAARGYCWARRPVRMQRYLGAQRKRQDGSVQTRTACQQPSYRQPYPPAAPQQPPNALVRIASPFVTGCYEQSQGRQYRRA